MKVRTLLAAVAAAIALPLAASAANASAPIAPAAAVALVKASPQLKIDKSVPPMGDYDAKLHPYVSVAHAPQGVDGGYIATAYAHAGKLGNGMAVLALPLDSGGSGGVFTQVIFAGTNASSLHYVGYLTSGGHLGVEVRDGAIVARYPMYGPNDPNCCPSKFNVDTYQIAGGKLRAVSSKTIPASPQPHRR